MNVIKEVTIGKELLTNIGNYSNIKVSHYVKFEVKEGEKPDYGEIYDQINQNLQFENDNMDPSWIKRTENNNEWKLTIKLPKRGGVKRDA